ncbi:MAG TPA: CDP-alcohol phosphatidyltransferase family protein [Candidatus Acidoferrales bacterium]|jgi:CDP-diacylglycerol--glycerol-3-phosphate 3-phosphatidyltransferase|nr:CDP-alcohol phosphatidyltransferase family protein [Candidatus Acidoferrales bacterium]
MVTRKIGEALRWVLYKIVHALAATGVEPNFLTFIGLVINIVAAYLFAKGRFPAAGGVMILAGLFDMVDGRVARAQGRVTKFGAYFDSVIDRYSDVGLYFGLLFYYASVNRARYAILVGVAMAGSVMVSYARARAESLIPECKAGFWERPERIVLLIIGALSNKMAPALWLLAIGPNITVIHRILHTWREAKAGHFVEVVPVIAPEQAAAKSLETGQAGSQTKTAPEGLVPGVAGERGR